MKTIIAGSRSINDYDIVLKAISKTSWKITTLISGTCYGVDRLGEKWAASYNIPIIKMPAKWNLYGRSAGVIRNYDMASKAEALIAIWDGKSTGTKNMINIARRKGLKIYIHRI